MKKTIFNSVKMSKPGKNVFNLSHQHITSLRMGELIPTMCMEMVPGDKFGVSLESLIRFQPMLAPVMHRFDVSFHCFFVANRLLWPNWENYITATPVAGLPPAFPYVNVSTNNQTKLTDRMGIPPTDSVLLEKVSAMPFAAYQFIYNEIYRDQNLVAEVPYELVDGNNDANSGELFTLRKRAWEPDYFTKALPFAQKGPAIEIPVLQDFPDVPVFLNSDTGEAAAFISTTSPTQAVPVGADPYDPPNPPPLNPPHIYANTSILNPGQPTTINDLRTAFRLQEWAEKTARAGSRYVESILGHFGVRSSDARLQRPEYITGLRSPVKISEVLNTTGTNDAPQGNMAGHGITYMGAPYKKAYFAEEHGYMICIMSILPKPAYMQGIPRHFTKINDYTEFFWPEFAHLGEQPVYNRELFAFNPLGEGDDTFGYNPKYSEYKFEFDRVSGDLRSSLDFWTAVRKFDNPPALNQEFIECDEAEDDIDRIFAVEDPDVDHIIVTVSHNIMAVRPMPVFGTPSF